MILSGLRKISIDYYNNFYKFRRQTNLRKGKKNNLKWLTRKQPT